MRKAVMAVTLLLALVSAATAQATPAPFGLGCTAENGVRFCQGGYRAPTVGTGGADPGYDRRVASFDGVPLDADVTLPASGDGPFPTIVFLHGWGGNKTDFEQSSPAGDGNELYHWNNVYYAQRGYAVLNYTARGFGDSCGSSSSRTTACAQGWIHLADRAFEARDSQFLLGTLVDEGIAQPNALGATGISYGGGQSIELAYLRNRTAVRSTAGGAEQLVPWTSPGKHIPLSLAAAYPRWPWSDLVSALVPNGRFLDFDPATAGASGAPIGVPIQSYIEGLYGDGNASGYYAPPGVDPGADLSTWHARIGAGDPYTDSEAQQIVTEIHAYHGGYGLDGQPAPMLLENGWTDDLFPPAESLRVYGSLRAADPAADVALQFGDLGHSRGSNKTNTDMYFDDQGSAFFDRHLKGDGAAPAPAPGSVTTFTQTCPQAAAAGGPFASASWQAIHPGAFRFGSAAAQSVSSNGGNPATGVAIDPIASSNACATVSDETAAGTAVYRSPAVTQGFTLLGLPTVTADVAITGSSAQLDSRLWDVAPNGQQTLVSRSGYRLADGQTKVTVQLHGNGWRFAPGHVAKLELLGEDPPYLQVNKEAFTLQLSNVVAELPTLEAPNSSGAFSSATGGQIVGPALGLGQRVGNPSLAKPQLRLSVTPSTVRAGRRTKLVFTAWIVRGRSRRLVSNVTIRFAGHTVRTGRRGRATMIVRFRGPGRRRAVASRRGYRNGQRIVRVVRRRR